MQAGEEMNEEIARNTRTIILEAAPAEESFRIERTVRFAMQEFFSSQLFVVIRLQAYRIATGASRCIAGPEAFCIVELADGPRF